MLTASEHGLLVTCNALVVIYDTFIVYCESSIITRDTVIIIGQSVIVICNSFLVICFIFLVTHVTVLVTCDTFPVTCKTVVSIFNILYFYLLCLNKVTQVAYDYANHMINYNNSDIRFSTEAMVYTSVSDMPFSLPSKEAGSRYRDNIDHINSER